MPEFCLSRVFLDCLLRLVSLSWLFFCRSLTVLDVCTTVNEVFQSRSLIDLSFYLRHAFIPGARRNARLYYGKVAVSDIISSRLYGG